MEFSKVDVLVVDRDLRLPLLISLMPSNANVPACVGGGDRSVLMILCMSCQSKVADSVVRTVSVDVVNLLGR